MDESRVVDTELVPDPKRAVEREARLVRGDHIQKRKRRKRGLTIAFDPDQLRKYVTGFRKRKQERKERAKKRAAEMQKKAKRIKRKEREQELKVHCGLGKHDKWSASSESEAEDKRIQKMEVYNTAEYKTIVHVQPISLTLADNASEEDE